MTKDNTNYAGIDIGDKTSLIRVINSEGELLEETRIPTTRVALEREFKQKAPILKPRHRRDPRRMGTRLPQMNECRRFINALVVAFVCTSAIIISDRRISKFATLLP